MKFNELDMKKISVIQICIATIVSILFQFVFPLTFQPLDAHRYGLTANHGDPGTNLVIFTVTQWYFSFSVAWFFYRDNRYINNFLAFSIIPLGFIAIFDFSIGLYYDYIHLFPIFVDILIFWKKRNTLSRKLIPYYLVILSVFMYSVYFLKLAYYQATVLEFMFNWAISTTSMICLALFFKGDGYDKIILE